MEALKKYFPLSFKGRKEMRGLMVDILFYLAAAVVVGVIMGLFSGIPVLNFLFGFVGFLAEAYVIVGIVLVIWDYVKNKK